MNRTIYSLAIVSILSFVSCGSAEAAESETTEATTEEAVTEEEVITEEVVVKEETVSKYNYEQDWEVIKEAILNGDIPGVGAWAGSDAVDAEYLIMGASESFVIEALKNTSYDDLTTEEQGDETYLVFYAEETYTDEDGNETGSSFALYLRQGDPSLLIEYYIAAG